MKNASSKIFFSGLILFFILGLIPSGTAYADFKVLNANLNGLSNLSASGSSLLRAYIEVLLTDGSVWRSTAYKFGNGEWVCVDTRDHSGNGIFSELFEVRVPAKEGDTSANFEVYSRDDCKNGNPLTAAIMDSFNFPLVLSGWFVILSLIAAFGAIIIVALHFYKKINSSLNPEIVPENKAESDRKATEQF